MKATFVKSVALVVFACSASALLGQSNSKGCSAGEIPTRAGESPASSKCAALKEMVRFWGPEMMPPELREECASTKIYDNTGESDVPGLPGKPTPQYPGQPAPPDGAAKPSQPIQGTFIDLTLCNGTVLPARWLETTPQGLKVAGKSGKIQFIDPKNIRAYRFTKPWPELR